MKHFFKIEGNIEAPDENLAIENLYELLFNKCMFQITITGNEDDESEEATQI